MPVVHDENDDKADAGSASEPSYMPTVEGAVSFGKGLGKGLGKGAAGMVPESVYNFVGAPGGDIKAWASSPGEGGAESAGEWTGDVAANVAPFFFAPELGIAAKAGEIANMAALGARTAGKIGQGAYRAITGASRLARGAESGAVGGAAEAALHNEELPRGQGDKFVDRTKRGAMEGGVTAAEFMAGRMAYEALPPAVKHLVQAGAFAMTAGGVGMSVWDRAGHHHWIPWHVVNAVTAPVLGAAAGATKLPPAVVGAGAERIGQGLGYEQTSPRPSQPDEGDYVEQPQ